MSELFWRNSYIVARSDLEEMRRKVETLTARVAYLEAHPLCPVCGSELEIVDSSWYCADDTCAYGDPGCEKVKA